MYHYLNFYHFLIYYYLMSYSINGYVPFSLLFRYFYFLLMNDLIIDYQFLKLIIIPCIN